MHKTFEQVKRSSLEAKAHTRSGLIPLAPSALLSWPAVCRVQRRTTEIYKDAKLHPVIDSAVPRLVMIPKTAITFLAGYMSLCESGQVSPNQHLKMVNLTDLHSPRSIVHLHHRADPNEFIVVALKDPDVVKVLLHLVRYELLGSIR